MSGGGKNELGGEWGNPDTSHLLRDARSDNNSNRSSNSNNDAMYLMRLLHASTHLTLHQSNMTQMLLLALFHRWGNEGPERSSDFP